MPAIVENTSYIYTSIYFCAAYILLFKATAKSILLMSRGYRNLVPVNPVLNHVACLTVSSGGLVHLNAAMSTCLMDIIVYFTVPSTSSHQSGEHPQQWYPSIKADIVGVGTCHHSGGDRGRQQSNSPSTQPMVRQAMITTTASSKQGMSRWEPAVRTR